MRGLYRDTRTELAGAFDPSLMSPMPIPELAEALAPGDCITHCFKGGSTRVTDDRGRIHAGIKAAAERGVLFDVGHGFGSFQWEVAQAALEDGFEPTTISTDLHTKNLHGPVYDMPTTMSKFLMLGTPLERVIEMSTTRPAQILNQAGELGTLKVGSVADIAVLEQHTGRFVLTDSYQQQRVGERLLTASDNRPSWRNRSRRRRFEDATPGRSGVNVGSAAMPF